MNIRHFAGIVALLTMVMTGNDVFADSSGTRELMPQQPPAAQRVTMQKVSGDQVLTTRKKAGADFARAGVPLIDPLAKQSSQLLARRVAASKKKLRGALIFNLSWYDLPSGTPYPYGVYELSTTERLSNNES